jgi:uncharacterized protein (DUF2062 family)
MAPVGGFETRQLAVVALLMAYAVELSLYVAHINGWTIANPVVLSVIVGSTPDGWDVLAYTLGFLCVFGLRLMK